MRVVLLLLATLVAIPLAACTTPDVRVPEEVRVEVPVPCVDPDDRPKRPALRKPADLLGLDEYTRTLAAWSDLRKYEGYVAELEAVVEGCSRIGR